MVKFFSAPPEGATIQYEISNNYFLSFCARTIVIFLALCADREVCEHRKSKKYKTYKTANTKLYTSNAS